MEEITSRRNERIKQHAKLLRSASHRREAGQFLCEGARLCRDAVRSGIPVTTAYFTQEAQRKYPDYCGEIAAAAAQSFQIVPEVTGLLSDTRQPQGVYCVCRMPDRTEPLTLTAPQKYLALENIQDPTNLGTVLRTAEALGIAGVLLSEGCCDPYSPKVLRGSMGAVFRMPMWFCADLPKEMRLLGKQGFTTMASVVTETKRITEVSFAGGVVLAIGNEGSGLTAETMAACAQQVTIPMLGRAESLNASAAAAILLWEMMRGEA